MMNYIWVILIAVAVVAGIFTGTISDVQDNLFAFADTSVELAIGLIGSMAFFCGLMKVMEDAGLCEKLGKILSPVLRFMFPGVPKDHPANSAIVMYMAASILGLGNACTPLGIKAMQELQKLNKTKNIATNDQCMVMAISTGSICIIPSNIIATRNAVDPTGAAEIVGPVILTTLVAALVCIISTRLLGKIKIFQYDYLVEKDRAAGRLQINEEYEGDDPLTLDAPVSEVKEAI